MPESPVAPEGSSDRMWESYSVHVREDGSHEEDSSPKDGVSGRWFNRAILEGIQQGVEGGDVPQEFHRACGEVIAEGGGVTALCGAVVGDEGDDERET